MILAVASGKGGTGKTTVAANMARVFGAEVQLLDCDVEAPNTRLFFRGKTGGEEIVTMPMPVVDESLCDGCGECGRFCEFHAIVSFGDTPLVFPELCHGCGGCTKVCPQHAISETGRRIGIVETMTADTVELITGRLDIGVAMAPPLIRTVKARQRDDIPTIIDAPPGTSCPVVASLHGVDAAVLVTEPTPFGLHDLRLAVDMVRSLGIPFGVAVNRAGSGDNRVRVFCDAEDIPVLAEIPDDRRIAEAYSRGDLAVDALPEYRQCFRELLDNALNLTHHAAHDRHDQ